MKVKFICLFICFFFVLFLTSCTNCSRSGSRSHRDTNRINQVDENEGKLRNRNIVKMREQGGVYFVPIIINGISMEFIFDTGASIISISAAEAIFLYKQGSLIDSDFIGTTRFSDATGNISEGTLLNLREVKIGNKTLNNIEASVVHNLDAPLLLGQSALNKFGKISIDYKNNELKLE